MFTTSGGIYSDSNKESIVQSITYYPSYVIDELGSPDENAYAISLWTGDQHLYYASWINANSADVSVNDFGIPRSNSGRHVILSFLLLLLLKIYKRNIGEKYA